MFIRCEIPFSRNIFFLSSFRSVHGLRFLKKQLSDSWTQQGAADPGVETGQRLRASVSIKPVHYASSSKNISVYALLHQPSP